jgi:hypothetical protein
MAAARGAHGGDPSVLDDQQTPELLNRQFEALLKRRDTLWQSRLRIQTHPLFREPSRHGNDVRAPEGEEAYRLDHRRGCRQLDLNVELHPGSLRPATGRPPEAAAPSQRSCIGGIFKIAARQFIVLHAGRVNLGARQTRACLPPIRRNRRTACRTSLIAVSTSASLVKRPRLKRRLLSARRSSRPRARST